MVMTVTQFKVTDHMKHLVRLLVCHCSFPISALSELYILQAFCRLDFDFFHNSNHKNQLGSSLHSMTANTLDTEGFVASEIIDIVPAIHTDILNVLSSYIAKDVHF